jgi:ribosomal protein S27E
MAASSPTVSVTVESRPRGIYVPTACPYCKKELEFVKPACAARGEPYYVRCSECKETYLGPKEKEKGGLGSGKTKGRRIGTGKRFLLRLSSRVNRLC